MASSRLVAALNGKRAQTRLDVWDVAGSHPHPGIVLHIGLAGEAQQ